MDKYAVKEVVQEHKGEKYNFPIGVLARNVETDKTHRFVSDDEKKKIGEIDAIKQSFQDGCNTLVSACTTYGSAPASNSPGDIAAAIQDIYNNRYASGYSDGVSAVKKDPSAFGISAGIRYDYKVTTQYFDDVKEVVGEEYKTHDYSYDVYISSNRQNLYAVTARVIAETLCTYSGNGYAKVTFGAKTVEGAIINSVQVTNYSPQDVNGNTKFDSTEESVVLDLFETPFLTNHDHIVIYINMDLAGTFTEYLGGGDPLCGARGTVSGITAKYK